MIPFSILPVELWLAIFSDLDFFALQNCKRVCKEARDVVKSASILPGPFRKHANVIVKKVLCKSSAALHPIFSCLEFAVQSREQQKFIFHPEGMPPRVFDDFENEAVGAELATSPPVSYLVVETYPARIGCEYPKGVTVQAVLESFREGLALVADGHYSPNDNNGNLYWEDGGTPWHAFLEWEERSPGWAKHGTLKISFRIGR